MVCFTLPIISISISWNHTSYHLASCQEMTSNSLMTTVPIEKRKRKRKSNRKKGLLQLTQYLHWVTGDNLEMGWGERDACEEQLPPSIALRTLTSLATSCSSWPTCSCSSSATYSPRLMIRTMMSSWKEPKTISQHTFRKKSSVYNSVGQFSC